MASTSSSISNGSGVSAASSKSSANKRWSQHIVASTYDDVCVLLKYQRRRHSQENLSQIAATNKYPAYATLPSPHHLHNNNNNSNNNNHNAIKCRNNSHATLTANGCCNSKTSSALTDTTSVLTQSSAVVLRNGRDRHDGNTRCPQQPEAQSHYRRGENPRRRLIRPVSCFEPGDHVGNTN